MKQHGTLLLSRSHELRKMLRKAAITSCNTNDLQRSKQIWRRFSPTKDHQSQLNPWRERTKIALILRRSCALSYRKSRRLPGIVSWRNTVGCIWAQVRALLNASNCISRRLPDTVSWRSTVDCTWAQVRALLNASSCISRRLPGIVSWRSTVDYT